MSNQVLDSKGIVKSLSEANEAQAEHQNYYWTLLVNPDSMETDHGMRDLLNTSILEGWYYVEHKPNPKGDGYLVLFRNWPN